MDQVAQVGLVDLAHLVGQVVQLFLDKKYQAHLVVLENLEAQAVQEDQGDLEVLVDMVDQAGQEVLVALEDPENLGNLVNQVHLVGL